MYLQHKSESTPYIQTKYSVIIRFFSRITKFNKFTKYLRFQIFTHFSKAHTTE